MPSQEPTEAARLLVIYRNILRETESFGAYLRDYYFKDNLLNCKRKFLLRICVGYCQLVGIAKGMKFQKVISTKAPEMKSFQHMQTKL